MIKTYDRLVNQLLATIYIDKNDNSVIHVSYIDVLKIFEKFDIVVPAKAFENTLNKVFEERLVGKIEATEVSKYAIAQAMLNTALTLAISKEELLRLKLRGEGVNYIDKKK